ncbi:MAG: hypothetical protein AB7K24_16675 [Gemmataceae bacterium]
MHRGARRLGFIVLFALVFPVAGQDEKKEPEKEKETLVAFGQPFYARIIKTEDGMVKMIMKERFLNGNKIDFRDKEVSVGLAESVKVRLQWHPIMVDGDGKPRPLTRDENTKFKGAGNLWGYTGSELNLEPGRVVQVYLGKPKDMKDAEPLIRMVYVAKEEGDERIDPAHAALLANDDQPMTVGKDDENALKPVGDPYIAKVAKVDKDKLILTTKERVFRNNQVQHVDKNITVPFSEETKIRIEWVPPVLDDEGNIKKLTDAEKTELKGPDKLWGYTGDVKNLQPERFVKVYMGKRGDEDPVGRMIYVAKQPGDDKVDPNNVAFTLGTEGDDPSTMLEGETKINNWGTPFDARVIKAEPNKVTLQLLSRRNVVLWLSKQAKIRTEWVAPKVLPDGKIGKYTETELAKLKGDAEAWGYTGNIDNLEPGRIVKVTLGKIAGKKVNPFVTTLQVAKEPGDDQVNVNFGAFAKPVPGTLPRVEGDPDPKMDEAIEPFGTPLVGRLEAFNGRQVTVLARTRVFDGQKVEYREQKVNYNVGPGMVARFEAPPFAFDTKGRVKKYTDEELKALQGPEHLWGFPLKGSQLAENLKPGSTVKIYLGRKTGDDEGKTPPFIRMIFIAKPPGAANSDGNF